MDSHAYKIGHNDRRKMWRNRNKDRVRNGSPTLVLGEKDKNIGCDSKACQRNSRNADNPFGISAFVSGQTALEPVCYEQLSDKSDKTQKMTFWQHIN